MQFLVYLSNFIMPFLIFYIVGFAFLMKKNVYEDFIDGAKDGLKTVVGILPTLVGLMVGVGALRASGFLSDMANFIAPLCSRIGMPSEVVPLSIVKMFSSSAATGLCLDVFKQYGTDSFIGRTASIMMSCTETIFYTMSVYFLEAKVTKTRWTLTGALVCTIAGIIASVVIAGMM